MDNKKILIVLVIAAALVFIFKDKIFGPKQVREGGADESTPPNSPSRPPSVGEVKKSKLAIVGRGYDNYEPIKGRGRFETNIMPTTNWQLAETYIPNN